MLSIDAGDTIDNDPVYPRYRGLSLFGLDLVRCLSFALFVIFFILLVW